MPNDRLPQIRSTVRRGFPHKTSRLLEESAMIKDMLGRRFGKLVAAARAPNALDGTAMWLCVCDCGETRLIAGTALRDSRRIRNRSCGCASPKFKSLRFDRHPLWNTRTYRIWRGMICRCENFKSKKAHIYALKGVRVCDRWMQFDSFLEDMGLAPYGLSIDRIDGNLGYEPENCRWATSKEQSNNTAANRMVSYRGRIQNVSQWAEEIGVKQNTILYRLRRGWSIDRALTAPIQRRTPQAPASELR